MAPPPNDDFWSAPQSGDWSNPGNWSPGVPSDPTAQATIAAPGTYTATIAAGESYEVGGVTLDDATATLEIDGTLLADDGVLVEAGTVAVAGSVSGIVTAAGNGVILLTGATPDPVTGPIVLAGGELTFYDPGSLVTNATIAVGQTVSGFGGILDSGNPVALTNQGVVTAAGGFLLLENSTLINAGLVDAGTGYLEILSTVFTNAGTLSSEGGFADLTGSFDNSGVISVGGGGELLLGTAGQTWHNDGTIAVADATVVLSGDETVADLGALVLSGSSVIDLAGTLENTGNLLDGAGGFLQGITLQGGTIVGGTLDAAALGLQITASYGALSGVTLINGFTVAAGSVAFEDGTEVFADAAAQTLATVDVLSFATLAFEGTADYVIDQPVTTDGGAIVLSGAFTLDSTIAETGGTLFVGTGTTTYDPTAGTATTSYDDWTNAGTIVATGGTLYLAGDVTVGGLGTIERTGAALYFAGTLDNTGATLDAASTLLSGLQLDGGTIEGGVLDPTSLGLVVGSPYFTTGNGFDNVTVAGDFTVTGALALSGTTALYADASLSTPGTVTIGSGGLLALIGTDTNAGQVALAGGTLTWELPGDAAGTLAIAIAAGQTLAGFGDIDDSTIFSTAGETVDDLTNFGVIAANQNYALFIQLGTLDNEGQILATGGAPLYLDEYGTGTWVNAGTIASTGDSPLLLGGSFLNSGLISAVSGAIELGSATSTYDAATASYVEIYPNWVNTGTIVTQGGEITLTGDETVAEIGVLQTNGGLVYYNGGTLENAGQTLGSLDTSLLGLHLDGGTIDGGTLDPTGLGLTLSYGGLRDVTVVNNLTLDGDVALLGTTAIFSDAAATIPGTLFVSYDGLAEFYAAGAATLDTPVTLQGGNLTWLVAGTLASGTVDVTIAASETIIGIGGLVDQIVQQTSDVVTNLGTIIDDTPQNYNGTSTVYGTLSVTTTGFDNAGLIEVSNGAALYLGKSFETYDAVSNSYVTLTTNLINTGIIEVTDASLTFIGNVDVAALGSIVLNNATLYDAGGVFDNTGQTLNAADTSLIGLQLDGGTIEGGTLDTTSLGFGIASAYQFSDLDNVIVVDNLTVDGRLELTGTSRVYANQAATQPGTISIGTYGTLIFVAGTQAVLRDPILLSGGAVTWQDSGTFAGAVDVTNPGTGTISGFGAIIDQYGGAGAVTLVNDGTIAAGTANANLQIGVTDFTNAGLIRVTGGASLTIGIGFSTYDPTSESYVEYFPTWINTGSIVVDGGNLFLIGDETLADLGTISLTDAGLFYAGGTFDNQGATLDGSVASLTGLQLAGGTIDGGVIDVAAAGFAVANGGDSALVDVTVAGNLSVNGYLLIGGSTGIFADAQQSQAGTITAGYYALVSFAGAQQETLVDDIVLTGGGLAWSEGQNAAAQGTIAAGVTIAGYGNIENDYVHGSADTIVNQGTILADVAFNYLSIDTTSFSNPGLLLATNQGNLYFYSSNFANFDAGTLTGGTYEADANSYLSLQYDTVTDAAADVILKGSGANLSFEQTLTRVVTGGTLELDSGALFSNTSTLSAGGLLTLGGGTLEVAKLDVVAGGTLFGFGDISSPVVQAGAIIAAGGGLTLGALSGSGTLTIDSFATLALEGANSHRVSLSGQDASLVLDDVAGFTGTIAGFTIGDELIIDGFSGTSATWDAGVLTIGSAGGSLALRVAGTFASDAFAASVPVLGETEIVLAQGQTISLDGPASLFDNPGTVIAVNGVAVLDGAGAAVTVTVAAGSGVLAASAVNGGVVQGNGTGTLTLSGNLATVNDELATLEYRAPVGDQETDSVLVDASDGSGSVSEIIPVTINQPPTLTLPIEILEQPGTAGTAAGFQIADPDQIAGETYVVKVADATGLLDATAAAGAALVGNGTTLLTLTGSLDAINSTLNSLTFDGSANDSIAVTANDGRGGVVEGFSPVVINHPPGIDAPGTIQGFIGTPTAVSGVSVVDPYGAAEGDTFTVLAVDGVGTLAATAVPGGTVAGDNTGTLTLTGTLGAVNAELASLQYTGTLTGYISDTIGLGVSDGVASEVFGSIDVLLPTPPMLTLPDKFVVGGGHESPLDGISVAVGKGLPGDTQVTLDISDTNGMLSVKIDSGVTVSGNDSTDLTLTGPVAALNTALSSLIYTGGASSSTEKVLDGLVFKASEDQATTSAEVLVDLPVVSGGSVAPQDFPVGVLDNGNYYGGALYLQWDQGGDGYVGTLYADLPASYGPDPTAAAAQIAFSIFNNNISSETDGGSAIQEPYAPVIGEWSANVPATSGPLAGFFATGTLFTTVDEGARQQDQITYTFQSTGSDAGQLPDRRLTIVFNKTTSVTVKQPSSTSTSSNTGPTPPNPPPLPPPPGPHGHGGRHGGGHGDVHLTTFDGLAYDFQAVGEFTLAKSTQPGDSFDIQARMAPWSNSASVSVMIEVAVGVGKDRVTFDITRSNVVWLNGAAIDLSSGAPVDLGAGTLSQLTPTSWQVLYDSGETVTVTNSGTFLDVDATIAPNAPAGSVAGLLGNANGNPANDLVLPDGTVLSQPLSSAQLYTTFADAWRITQAESLLDYGAGQTTATFTDLNFPSDSVSLASLPASVLQNAQLLVEQAGITDPAAIQGAIEDYALTGNVAFITAGAQAGATQQSSSILSEPVSTTLGVGVAAVTPSVTLSATGTTTLDFLIYATGTSSIAQTITYAAAAPGLGAGAFAGGVLPSGTVTIAAGQTSAVVAIDLLGTIGAVPSAQVTLDIGASLPVIGPTAVIAVDNDTPTPGTPAVAGFVAAGGPFAVIGSGTAFTLDVGTLAQGSALPYFTFDITNDAVVAADTLFGELSSTGNAALIEGGLRPVTALTGGELDPYSFTVATGQLGAVVTTVTLDANEYNESGFAADIGAVVLTIDALITDQPPTIVTPLGELEIAGQAVPLPGIDIVNTGAAGALKIFTVTLGDTAGILSATSSGIGTVVGSGSTQVTLTGGLTAVNAELAGLTFDGQAPDTITVTASDGAGGIAQTGFAVTVDQPPAITAPASAAIAVGAAEPVAGLAITDPSLAASGGTLAVAVADTSGILAVTLPAGVTKTSGFNAFTLTGTLAGIDAALATFTDFIPASGVIPGTDHVTLTATDPLGLTSSDVVTITPVAPAPAVISAPGTVAILAAGVAASLGTVLSVADANAAASASLVVTVTDLTGILAATAGGGGGVIGAGSGAVTLTGGLAAVNAELASLTYTGAVPGDQSLVGTTDTITLQVTDAFGTTIGQMVTADVDQIPFFDPALTALDTLGADATDGAGAAQLITDGVAFYNAAVSGAIGSAGGTIWQDAFDASSGAAATLAAAGAAPPLADTVALLNTVLAGTVGAIAANASQSAYQAILAAAVALGDDIVAGAAAAQLDSDLATVYGAISAAAPNAVDPGGFGPAQAASQLLAADLTGATGSAELTDFGALYDSIIAGSLGAIGGPALQLDYADSTATAALLAADIAAGATASQIAVDVSGIYDSVIAGVAAPGSTQALDAVMLAGNPFVATLAAGQSGSEIVNDAVPLYNAVGVGIIDGRTGGSIAEDVVNINNAIQAAQSAIADNAAATVVAADIDAAVDTSISGLLADLGLNVGQQAFSAALQAASAAGQDLADDASTNQSNTDFAAYLGSVFGAVATVAFGATADQNQAIIDAFAKIAADGNAGVTSQATTDLVNLYEALNAGAGTAVSSSSGGTGQADGPTHATAEATAKKGGSAQQKLKDAQAFAKAHKTELTDIFNDLKAHNFSKAIDDYINLVKSTYNDAVTDKLGLGQAAKYFNDAVKSFFSAAWETVIPPKNRPNSAQQFFANGLGDLITSATTFYVGKKLTTKAGGAPSSGRQTSNQVTVITQTVQGLIYNASRNAGNTLNGNFGSTSSSLLSRLSGLLGDIYKLPTTVFNDVTGQLRKDVIAGMLAQIAKFIQDLPQIPEKNVFGTIVIPLATIGGGSVAIPSPLALIPGLLGGNTPPDTTPCTDIVTNDGGTNGDGGSGGSNGDGGTAEGDVHLTTFDGLYYNFQAAGEFLLAKSTQPGDSFQIQIRLQPWTNSASVSVITEAAVAVGTNRVTFDVDRTVTVWINGAATSLTTGVPRDLGAGTITQLTATSWQILYDSGETVSISDEGAFLDVAPTIPSNTPTGGVAGLLGDHNGDPALDLVTANGQVLTQPLSYTDLYTTFADSWRLTQAQSLLDYGAGQTTATFTDIAFPADAASLAGVPASVLATADQLIAAAGITDPALIQGAEEDYVLTGNPAFITAAAAQQAQATGTSLVLADPANPAQSIGIGVAAPTPIVLLSNSGTTEADFLIYATGTSAIAQTVGYQVVELGATSLGAAAFAGDVLPSGTVTIAAGQTTATVALDVLGSLGTLPAAELDLVVSSPTGAPVIGSTAQVTIASDQPVVGTSALPAFIVAGSVGVLTQDGNAYTLDLGTFAQDATVPALAIDIANLAIGSADTLFGDETYLGNGPVTFSTGLPPVVSLPAGGTDPLSAVIDTTVAGTILTTVTFDANQFNASGYEAALDPITLTITGNILAPGPTLATPAAELELIGTTVTLAGLGLIDIAATAATDIFTVTIADQTGLLGATAVAGATVGPAGLTQMVLTGSLAAVNAELAGLTYTGSGPDTLTVTATDGTGGVTQASLPVTIDAAPSITAPAALTGLVGQDGTLAGLSVSDPTLAAAGGQILVSLADASGLLSVQDIGGIAVAGAGSTSLTLLGTLAAINASLATLTDIAGSAADAIAVTAIDPAGLAATASIAITPTDPPPPALTLPASAVAPLGQAGAITGVSVADPGLAAAGGTLTVMLGDSAGLLSTAQYGTAAVSGVGTTGLTITGTPTAVNAELASLTDTGPAGATADTITVMATDPLGQISVGRIATLLDTAPAIAAPAAIIAPLGTAGTIGAVMVADPGLPTGRITVQLSDRTGLLAAAGGAGATTLTLSGSPAQIDAALAGVTVTGPAAPGLDSISVVATDAFGLAGTQTIGVEFDTAPVIIAPASFALTPGETDAIAGLSLSDPGQPGTLTVTLADGVIALSATAVPGATVTGGGTSLILGGSVAGVAAELASLTGTAPAGATADSLTITAVDPYGLAGTAMVALVAGEAPCFLAGTDLLTTDGPVAVEALRVGDQVVTAGGATRGIRWIGDRHVDCARHPAPERVWPIRFAAGALADGVPRRPLWLSPDHALFLDGVLMPAKALVNDATITQVRLDRAHYFHVELDSHDIVLAEGAAVESYLDTGNRGSFANGGPAIALHPEFAALDWTHACAKLCTDGPLVVTMRQRLLRRAIDLGHTRAKTPGLHLRLGDRVLQPVRVAGTLHRFLLPAGAEDVIIASAAGRPRNFDQALTDGRLLGVALAGIALDGRLIALDDPALADGFQAMERRENRTWRWTDGAARLRLARRRPAALELRVIDAMAGWDDVARPAPPDRDVG